MNGILNIFKPEGITSNGVINQVKRLTGEKKVGHIGTLDPLAKGVLPLFLGKYTKLIPHFNLDSKCYRAVAMLGATSTTMDREGDLEEVPIPETLSETGVKKALDSFLGDSHQIPPMHSAIKVDGKKLYELARQGKEIERKPRLIHISEITLLRFSDNQVEFEVHCSKGTYIRSLVDDIAVKLGTRAYLFELTRIKSGEFFSEKNAIHLADAKKMAKTDLQSNFIDPKWILFDWHSVTISSAKQIRHLSQGRTLDLAVGDIELSDKGKHFSNAFVTTQTGELLASGILEFSQGSKCKFRPGKVFM